MKSQYKYRVILNSNEMPRQWYNILADLNTLLPPLHPATLNPVCADDLSPLFPMELIKQEVSKERFIDIPSEVMKLYRMYRPSPLIRAVNLEKHLDTPAKIYFKNESVSPSGSHKTNTAIPQAFYNKMEGVKQITTETGAGQWGSALSFAANYFGIGLKVFMVKISYEQKPYRKMMMNTWNTEVIPSPSNTTEAGRKILSENQNSTGSLGIAISEAVECAMKNDDTKYALGSVLNHVLLHQTIIGQEALKQIEFTGDYPDVVIGCFGGGSNFAGITFPFIYQKKLNHLKTRFIAAEPASCPKLTRGRFCYDFGDSAGMTPLLPMYTLGHSFVPAEIHAGGLRYHGAASIVSQLLKENQIEAVAINQLEAFKAGVIFAQTEGIIPAPESTHAIASAIREALIAKRDGKEKTILFNLSGHGLVDLSAYDKFLSGQLVDYDVPDLEIERCTSQLKAIY